MEFEVGTPLIKVLNSFELNETQEEYKKKITDFCREELEHGDSKISNEIEASILNAWVNNCDKVKMPIISDKYKLTDSYSYSENELTKNFEEYEYNGKYYIQCITNDSTGKIIKHQLTFHSEPLKEFLTSGGVEDCIFDNNHDGIADSRIIIKSKIDNNGIKNTKMFSDINLDGKLD